MPKEWTHWHIARQVLLGLPDVPLRKLIERQRHPYLLGAVLPDAPLYAQRLRPGRVLFRQLGRRFHDPEQAPALVRSHLMREGAADAAAAALGLGALTHVLADILVHPAVDAAAGDDLGQHFAIETRLDLLLTFAQQADRLALAPLVWRCGKQGWRGLGGRIAALFAAPDYVGHCVWMLFCHAGLQGTFSRRYVHRAVVWLQRRGIAGMGAYRRLFYHDPDAASLVSDRQELAACMAAVQRTAAVCGRLFAEGGDLAGVCAQDDLVSGFSGSRCGRRP